MFDELADGVFADVTNHSISTWAWSSERKAP